MANIPADLIRFNGQIGPQVYNEDTGKMEPLTKKLFEEIIAKEVRGNVSVKVTGSYVGLTISDAPSQAENGHTFYAINENDGDGQAYLYFNGQWRAI